VGFRRLQRASEGFQGFRGLKRALEASEGFRGLRGLLEALEGFCKASEDFEENFGGVQRAPGGFGRIFRCFGGMGG